MTLTFTTEADLCRAFIETLPEGWTAYPETADFDILLVRDDGFQIGVEAKRRLNAKVIEQAAEGWYDVARAGPDCRAVLVPEGKTGSLGHVCRLLGLTVITVEPRRNYGRVDVTKGEAYQFRPQLPRDGRVPAMDPWHEWCPVERCRLPEYMPDAIAGSSSPLRLTDWKIKAIKVCILVERRGYVTRQDFKMLRLDHRRWLNALVGWLAPLERGIYGRGPHFPDFRREHPKSYTEIEADFENWAPPDHGEPARQTALTLGGRS